MSAHRTGLSVDATIARALIRDPDVRTRWENCLRYLAAYVAAICGIPIEKVTEIGESAVNACDWDETDRYITTAGQIRRQQ